MNILIIGASGREHAIIFKLLQSPLCDKVYCAPGNAGIAKLAECVDIMPEETEKLCEFAIEKMIGLTIVSSASPLALGIVDRFESDGLKVFGPTVDAVEFTEDNTRTEAFLNKYIPRHAKEDKTKQDNIGLQCICDGVKILPISAYKLYRTLYDNDEGEITDGMGAYTPLSSFHSKQIDHINENIIAPLTEGFLAEGLMYKGILNLKLTPCEDEFRICGFGAYMGEPETELLLLRLENDLVKIVLNATDSSLVDDEIKLNNLSVACCVLVSGGYPNEYRTNLEITLPEEEDDIYIFHGKTILKDGKLLTNGGRVLYVCATAEKMETAHEKLYDAIAKISFSGMYYRSDIAREVL